MSWPCLGLRLLLLAAGAAPPEEKKPVPLYTNEDLDRISPHRDETSQLPGDRTRRRRRRHAGPTTDAPDRKPMAHAGRPPARPPQRARERIDDLRARIAEKEAKAAGESLGSRSRRGRSPASSDASLEAMRRQLAAMEARVRDEETRFEERARREGALPGWLR
jgi:hypothetical protein